MAEPTGRAYRDVLAIPGARALIGASAASQIGNWLYNAALLGYVYGETRSAGWVGAATICRLVPYVLLGPFGGAIADRYPRRAVLLAGDVLRVLVMAALAATVASARLDRIPGQRGDIRHLRAADLDNASRRGSGRRPCVRGCPAGRGAADGAHDCVRAVADRDRGDGRIHLRSPDRAARRVRHALA